MDDDVKSLLIGVVLVFVLFFGCIAATILIRPFEMTGSHTGYVTAVDRDEFCTDIYFKTQLDSSQEDSYSISPENQYIDELEIAMRNKENVTINYERTGFGLCDSKITGVEKVEIVN